MRISPRLLLCLLPLMSGFLGAVSAAQTSVVLKPEPADQVLATMTDKSLEPFRVRLLQLAFDTASDIPVVPHIKTRCQMQQDVFNACLELDQTASAAKYLKQIGDWRRGVGYGDLALYCLRHDRTDGVKDLLAVATELTRIADQDWRKSEIMARVAKAEVWLGQLDSARKIEEKLELAEKGAVAEAKAEKGGDKAFDEQMQWAAAAIATGKHDELENAMGVTALLYNTYFKDPERRGRAEQALREASKEMPVFMRIKMLLNLAWVCAENHDPATGLKYVDEAEELVASAQWPAVYYVPLMGRIVKMRAKCQDVKGATADADKMMAFFDEHKSEIRDYEQAESLRPFAETYKILGDAAKSLEAYRRAVETGAANPNARARAEDLTATCLSMALNAVEPDEQLWKRMREIRAGLGDPW